MRALVIVALAAGCLPSDDRPEPGSIFVTAEPSEAIADGFTTPDGWTVTFDRFVTAVGDVNLQNEPGHFGGEDSCVGYNETWYEWLYDFAVTERSKVGLVHGLGRCSVEFRFRAPSDDSVIGTGTTEEDAVFMRTRGTDAYALDERGSLLVRGRAERDGVAKTFDWLFRRGYEVRECTTSSGDPLDGFVSVLPIAGGDELTLHIVLHGEELFRLGPIDEAPLHFDPFASADTDGDGAITLEELGEVEMPAIDPSLLPPELGEMPIFTRPDGMPPRLSDLIYELQLPRVARLAGSGPCAFELRQSRR